jgi:hypothetical protein
VPLLGSLGVGFGNFTQALPIFWQISTFVCLICHAVQLARHLSRIFVVSTRLEARRVLTESVSKCGVIQLGFLPRSHHALGARLGGTLRRGLLCRLGVGARPSSAASTALARRCTAPLLFRIAERHAAQCVS